MDVKIYSNLSTIARYVKDEWLFFVSLFLLVVSSALFGRIPSFSPDEFETLFTLFVFLILLKVLEEERLFHLIVERFLSDRFALVKLVASAGILSLFITNDIALMVTVPLTLIVDSPYVGEAVILESLAVNGLSAVSPVGNPQNIYIFYHFSPELVRFVEAVLPLGGVVFVLVVLRAFMLEAKVVERSQKTLLKRSCFWLGLFLLFLLSAVKILPLWVGIVVVFTVLFKRRGVFARIDYFLFGTFLCFFGFADNISHFLKVAELSGCKLFVVSSLLSQVMSNVPAALLLSDFTSDWKSLLWGVSVGGFGTLVASMANLIAYRLYVKKMVDSRGFLFKFHVYSFFFFFLGVFIYFVLYSW